jgi:hypothetical protein
VNVDFVLLSRSLSDILGYGQSGPYSQAAGYDVVVEAEAGLMHMCIPRPTYTPAMLTFTGTALANGIDRRQKWVSPLQTLPLDSTRMVLSWPQSFRDSKPAKVYG